MRVFGTVYYFGKVNTIGLKKEVTEMSQAGTQLCTAAEGQSEPRTVHVAGQARACGLPYPTLFGFLMGYGRVMYFIV